MTDLGIPIFDLSEAARASGGWRIPVHIGGGRGRLALVVGKFVCGPNAHCVVYEHASLMAQAARFAQDLDPADDVRLRSFESLRRVGDSIPLTDEEADSGRAVIVLNSEGRNLRYGSSLVQYCLNFARLHPRVRWVLLHTDGTEYLISPQILTLVPTLVRVSVQYGCAVNKPDSLAVVCPELANP